MKETLWCPKEVSSKASGGIGGEDEPKQSLERARLSSIGLMGPSSVAFNDLSWLSTAVPALSKAPS